jgi:ADP-ribose pyrophosphatase YjhB (NUDIX family)
MAAPSTPSVGCDVFVPDSSRTRVLLIRRADNGFWALPGGFHDLNETPMQCVVRECLEETGVSIRIARLIGVFSSNCYREMNYPHKGGKYCHILFLAETVDPARSAAHTTSEAREIGWFTERQVPAMSDGHDVRVAHGFRSLGDPLTPAYFE